MKGSADGDTVSDVVLTLSVTGTLCGAKPGEVMVMAHEYVPGVVIPEGVTVAVTVAGSVLADWVTDRPHPEDAATTKELTPLPESDKVWAGGYAPPRV